MKSREEIKKIIERKLREQFPHDTVDISDGYQDRIHIIVVSRKFDEMTDKDATEYLWSLIQNAIEEDEQTLISLIIPYSPAILK